MVFLFDKQEVNPNVPRAEKRLFPIIEKNILTHETMRVNVEKWCIEFSDFTDLREYISSTGLHVKLSMYDSDAEFVYIEII